MQQHVESSNRSAKEVLAKAKELQKNGVFPDISMMTLF
jgi:hypothetical protein